MVKEAMTYCYHCGDKGSLKHLQRVNNGSSENIGDDDFPYIMHFEDFIDVLVCKECFNISIYRTQYNEDDIHQLHMISPEVSATEEFGELIYPNVEQENKRYIPEKIYNSYLSSIKVQNIDMAFCLIGLRRTLEMICKDQGYNEGMLGQKLKKMAEDQKIPPIIDSIATGLKDQGNKAAHGDDVDFTNNTVKHMIEFTRIILNYIYSLPGKIAAAQEDIKDSIPMS